MNYKDTSGYEVVYPKNISNIVLASDHLQGDFSLADNSVIDDAFDYINRKLILIQYNKAGINVTVKSAGGSPLEGVPIPNITLNYDGTGEVVTDSNGTAFGYCDAGTINIAPVSCADVTYTSQQIKVLASEMYNVEIIGTVINFVKYTSSGSLMFSNNVQSIDVTLVGGGGGGSASSAASGSLEYGIIKAVSGSGGGGGNCIVQSGITITPLQNYPFSVGSGGAGGDRNGTTGTAQLLQMASGSTGGTTSFNNINAEGGGGGMGGTHGRENNNYSLAGTPGSGNGNGGQGRNYNGKVSSPAVSYAGYNGSDGTIQGYSSFSEMVVYSGGGAGGSLSTGGETAQGASGGGYGGDGVTALTYVSRILSGGNGTNGYGGGGAGASVGCWGDNDYLSKNNGSGGQGGSGCLAIRMHLKVTA